ncbi:hypothetical protein ISS06_00430 [Patescibacteria group bacterium]|nr:hypothetical protein [Patescibacteria group bacterium]
MENKKKASISEKQNKKKKIKIKDFFDNNPTLWKVVWEFYWRMVVIGICLGMVVMIVFSVLGMLFN